MELTEKRLDGEEKYRGIVVDIRVDRVSLPDGRESRREVVSHPGGVCVLPITEDGQVYLVRQFRYAVGRELLEVPAGKLEKGEEPRLAALRELEEEVGIIPARLDYLGGLYVSPGITTEIIHLYVATGLRPGTAHLDPDEFLQVEKVPFDQALKMALAGELPDAKTAALILKAALLEKKENEHG